jgi:hypothetical protein
MGIYPVLSAIRIQVHPDDDVMVASVQVMVLDERGKVVTPRTR